MLKFYKRRKKRRDPPSRRGEKKCRRQRGSKFSRGGKGGDAAEEEEVEGSGGRGGGEGKETSCEEGPMALLAPEGVGLFQPDPDVVFTLKIGKNNGGEKKKRVRWPDLEGEKETCYELRGFEVPDYEEEEEEGDDDDDHSDDEETDDDDDDEVKENEVELKEESESEEEREVNENPREPDVIEVETSEEEDEDEESDSGQESEVEEVKKEKDSPNGGTLEDEEEIKSDENDKSEDEEDGTIDDLFLKDNDINGLYSQIAELQKNVLVKTSGMERLQNELEAAYNESELARKRFRRLQDELDAVKRCNRDLLTRLSNHSEGEKSQLDKAHEQLNEAEEKIQELERKLSSIREDNSKLHSTLQRLEKEREQEMQMVQKALEGALREREEEGRKYEELRTVNADRELKLVEDFEWKLREVERDAKKKLREKDIQNEILLQDMAGKLSSAQQELEKLSHLEVCEIELKQVKAASQEQKRNLRQLTRKYEEIQVSEKILQEETNRLRSALDKEKANFSAIQDLHKDDLAEKERKLKFKLEIQKNQLISEWEGRLKRESAKLKSELERSFREEKRLAIETAKQIKEQESAQNKAVWEKKFQENAKELANWKRKFVEKVEEHRRDLENVQSKSDSDKLELRRKLDKLDMSYQEKIEKLQENHEKELEKIKEEYEKRVQQCETNVQIQAGTSRATLELVKQQMQKEADAKVHNLKELHQKEMEQQRKESVKEKESALEELQTKHLEMINHLRNEVARLSKRSGGSKEEVHPITCFESKFKESRKNSRVIENEVTPLKNGEGLQIINDEKGEAASALPKEMGKPSTENSIQHIDVFPEKRVEDTSRLEKAKQNRNQPVSRNPHRRSRKHKRH